MLNRVLPERVNFGELPPQSITLYANPIAQPERVNMQDGGSGGSSLGHRLLFVDNCDSATLPDGVTLANGSYLAYDATNKRRTGTEGYYVEYSLEPAAVADKPFVNFVTRSDSPRAGIEQYIYIDGTLRWAANLQADGNIAVFRFTPTLAVEWQSGFSPTFAGNETWFSEVSIKANGGLQWFGYTEDRSKSFLSTATAPSGWSASGSNSVTVALRLFDASSLLFAEAVRRF